MQPSRRSVQLEGRLRLSYLEYGSAEGEPVVLLHGYPDSSFSFSRVLPLLDPLRYRVYALDQRGHGESDKPESGYGIDEFAGDVVAFLDAVGVERATLVGHSFGTLVARRVAAAHASRVDRLVLIGSSVSFAVGPLLDLQSAIVDLADPVPWELAYDFQAGTGLVPLPEGFLERAVSDSLKVPARAWRGVLDALISVDDEAQLAQVRAPTLVIWGERDPLFDREQQDGLIAAIPGARLLVYPETGHNPHWERPTSVAYDLVSFFTQPADADGPAPRGRSAA